MPLQSHLDQCDISLRLWYSIHNGQWVTVLLFHDLCWKKNVSVACLWLVISGYCCMAFCFITSMIVTCLTYVHDWLIHSLICTALSASCIACPSSSVFLCWFFVLLWTFLLHIVLFCLFLLLVFSIFAFFIVCLPLGNCWVVDFHSYKF